MIFFDTFQCFIFILINRYLLLMNKIFKRNQINLRRIFQEYDLCLRFALPISLRINDLYFLTLFIREHLSIGFLSFFHWKNLNDLSKNKKRIEKRIRSFFYFQGTKMSDSIERREWWERSSGRTQIDSILRKTFCKITTPLDVTRFELCDGKTREIPLFWPRIEIPGRWIQRTVVVAFVHERFIHFSNVEERQRILGPGFLSVALTTIMYSLYLSSALYKASSVPFHRDTRISR